ncbi:DegT/DnrJ/EryC1/StrS family aminotransferase [Paenibacillus sp. J5C_2022]|uniref:DegT/DnrJ/EryC1/StrS family aminotransferase n=1 Tax=Paenibacillus sp. J5C2022 TaxID=2977129 RepID=UPI0021CE2D03|nr:DegT/DnrJ/EryC1/StrS family aminotransferase [Paenibacillus sp. J5C2022]MCU6710428.1 DegT/DnrJ/EryC1/StrS family aminotransferase [Paenibacillus sp. J5C2022]
MKIPLIDLRAQYMELRTEIDEAISRVLHSGVYIGGPEVEAFEQEITAVTGANHAVSVGNGTDALLLALEAAGIGAGDEVVTTPFTFFATAESIVRRGAIPVFADIDERTYNLSPEAAAACITPRTKAIMPVHLFGQPADMDAFRALADRHGLLLIEDACQALGAAYKGRPVGGTADISCISFFPTKNLGGYGDGGIVVTGDAKLADRVHLLAHHGSRKKYFHETTGCNSRLDPLHAAVLRVKLAKLQEWNERRRGIAAYYDRHLAGTGIVPPYASPDSRHVYHLYATQCPDRANVAAEMRKFGISTGHYYPCPLHLQEALRGLGYRKGDFPVTERTCEHSLSLPISPQLPEEQQIYIMDKLHEVTGGSVS